MKLRAPQIARHDGIALKFEGAGFPTTVSRNMGEDRVDQTFLDDHPHGATSTSGQGEIVSGHGTDYGLHFETGIATCETAEKHLAAVVRQQDLGSITVAPIIETQGVGRLPATFRLHSVKGADDLDRHAP